MTSFQALSEGVNACRIVDLSSDVGNHADGPFKTEIDALEPEPGARFFCENVLPKVAPHAVGRLRPENFPKGAFLRHEMVRASVHAGSHVDAPGHYGPADDGSPGFINEAPLGSFIAPGLMYDVSRLPDDVVGLRHVDVPGRGSEGAIALIRTGGGKAIGSDLVEAFLDAGITVLGTDGESFDGPFAPMIDRYLASGDDAALWPAHVLGRSRPYYQLERLRNLEALPASGFLVIAFPVLIEGATAAWTRAVALVPEGGAAQAPGTEE
ncbi:cyclase family protein [Microbispora rosea]|uniref:cyclase family protein n=1 Tax=Microbispora rosea TaxID=58117 RepID=UPI00341EC1BB